MMTKYEFVLRFSMISNIKSQKLKTLLATLDNECNAANLIAQLNLNHEQKNQFYQCDISHAIEWLKADDHHLVVYGDALYPALLMQISAAPLLLFVLGNPYILNYPQIAMVGSRSFSDYGARWGRFFASELAMNQLTITSGMALGMDAICHRGALSVDGHTIAVLGSGLDHISPKTNLRLAQDILSSNGAIISEFMPSVQARAEYFPRRNRIISGLSLGTFVVEAAEKSGTLITARYALEQNRDVFALPGDIDSENSAGTHWLIKQGAYLVSHPTDILEHYANHLSYLKGQQVTDSNENGRNLIHTDILMIIGKMPVDVDTIAEKSGASISEINVKLIELELEGLIEQVTGGFVRYHSI